MTTPTSYRLFLCLLLLIVATKVTAQDHNQELKERLRQQALPIQKIGQKQLEHDLQPIIKEANKPFEVGPYSRLPRRGDELILLNPTMPEQELNLNFNWRRKPKDERTFMDDIAESGFFDRDVFNEAMEEAPAWVRTTGVVLGILLGGVSVTLDPVRAYQEWLQAKHQRQVDKVMKVYGIKKEDIIISYPPEIRYTPDSTYLK